jgi:hypothetical protein
MKIKAPASSGAIHLETASRMSASPPKADSLPQSRNVRFVLIAEIEPQRTTLLIKIAGILVVRGYSQLIPASGSTR